MNRRPRSIGRRWARVTGPLQRPATGRPHAYYLAIGFPPAAKSCAYRMRETANQLYAEGWDVTVDNDLPGGLGAGVRPRPQPLRRRPSGGTRRRVAADALRTGHRRTAFLTQPVAGSEGMGGRGGQPPSRPVPGAAVRRVAAGPRAGSTHTAPARPGRSARDHLRAVREPGCDLAPVGGTPGAVRGRLPGRVVGRRDRRRGGVHPDVDPRPLGIQAAPFGDRGVVRQRPDRPALPGPLS